MAGASTASASPIYVVGNECPADPIGSYNRQYYVTQATHCVFDTDDTLNIQGTDAEAALYLDGAPAPWGDDWEGLGQNPTGFTWTADAGNDDGTFTIGALLTAQYGQFAVGVKDGGSPKFAIFLLPVGVTTGDWGLLTNGGDLSHFALYGRGPGTSEESLIATPEPATLVLLGLGLAAGARRLRRKH
jgi:PEP-CTERM motif